MINYTVNVLCACTTGNPANLELSVKLERIGANV